MYRYLLTLTMLLMCLHAEGQVTPDVRRVVWGMAKEEVRNTEKLEPLSFDVPGVAATEMYDSNENVSVLMYQTRVVGISAFLVYTFVDDKLGSMAYASSEDHSDNNLYASDFENLNSTLYGKYGRWKSDDDNATDLEQRAKLDMRFILGRGGYRRTVIWQTPRTVIRHQISNNDLGVAHLLIYESLEFNNRRKKSIQDDI